jgi:hypothetical protein
MYKASTYLNSYYFPTYLCMNETYFLQNWLPRWNQIFNSVEIHPQQSNKGHPVDGASRITFHTQLLWMPTKIFGDCKIVSKCDH